MNPIRFEIMNNTPPKEFLRNFESNNRRTEKYWSRMDNVVVTEIITTNGGDSK